MVQNRTEALPQNYNIQALRAAAAVGVVLHHMIDSVHNYLAPGAITWDPSFGSYGVDLFFVISGFVMMMIASRKLQTPAGFMRDRLIRIVPLYWLLTLLACVPLLAGFRIFGNSAFSIDHLLRSLFFIPPTGDADMPFPILFVGWTLNYEMMFYALFALAIAWVKPSRRAVTLAAAIISLVGLRFITGWSALDFIGDAIIVGFALGLLLWEALARTHVSPRGAATMLAVGAAALILLDVIAIEALELGRAAVSVAAALVVWGAISLERSGKTVGQGAVSRVGDASYALYLVHPFVLQFVGKAAVVSGFNRSGWGLTLTMLAMAVSSLVTALLVHQYLEKPLITWLKRQGEQPKIARPGAA